MRFLAYSDIHFHHGWPEFNPPTERGTCRWLEIQLDVWRQINAYAKQYEVTAKLFAGDLVHKRSFIHTTTNNCLLGLYKQELQYPEVLISGNHDRYSQDFNAVEALRGLPNVTVLPGPDKDPGCHFHIASGGKITDQVQIYGALPGGAVPPPNRALDGVNILLAHGMLNGAKSQSGFELKGGYQLVDFAAYDLVVMGDIHAKQLHGNVLIPGAPLQMSWGDTALTCGCWLIDTSYFTGEEPGIAATHNNAGELQWTRVAATNIGVKFLPITAPRFVNVTPTNFTDVLATTDTVPDETNYYDFKLTEPLDDEAVREIKRRFPQSYLSYPPAEVSGVQRTVAISSKSTGPEGILRKYHALRVKTAPQEEFVREGLRYLLTADPKQKVRGHKQLEILWVKAENFGPFQSVMLDVRQLTEPLYQVTGTSDDQTSTVNGTGKSMLATEILCYTLYDKLARSSSRSKDRLIHDPRRTGKAKNMLGEVGLRVGDTTYIVQRYRKHEILGTGSRVLQSV